LFFFKRKIKKKKAKEREGVLGLSRLDKKKMSGGVVGGGGG